MEASGRYRLGCVIYYYEEFVSTYRQQNFSFSGTVINYITKNPSLTLTVYQKMSQSCKYFYIKNPILILHCLSFHGKKVTACCKDDCEYLGFYDKHPLYKIFCKVGITEQLLIRSFKPTLASSLIPRIYQCDALGVELVTQILNFKDFIFLTSNAERLILDKTVVTSEDGSKLSLETLIAALPKLDGIFCTFSPKATDHSPHIFEELLKIQHIQKLEVIRFHNVSEIFDVDVFYDYLKKNGHVQAYLTYRHPIADAVKVKLNAIVDEILKEKSRKFAPPFIQFPGLNGYKRKNLQKLVNKKYK